MMRYLLASCLALALCSSSLMAQEPTPTSAPIYHIVAEDVLDVTVQDHADLSKTISVLPDGTVSYPYVGEFTASGLTLRQVADRISTALSKQVADPMVSVTLRTKHEAPASQVSILGAVKTPGKRALKDGWRFLDLLTDAGGLTVDRPELVTCTLVRHGTDQIEIDVPAVLNTANNKVNEKLMPDDIVLIKERDPSLTHAQVTGEVDKPGSYAVPADGSVTSIIRAAGGATPKAALSKARLTHNGVSAELDLHTALTTGAALPGVKIVPGDTLFIPQNNLTYSLFGAVGHPGVQEFPDGGTVTVLSALSMAGGQGADANLKSVSLIHPVKGGKPTVTTVNVEIMLKKGDLTKDLPISPGDYVYVPSKSQKTGTMDGIMSVLPIIGLLRIL